MSPALQGGFLTTGPPGMSPNKYSWTTTMFRVLAKWGIWRRNVNLLNTTVVLDIVCTSLQLIITVHLGGNYYTTQYCRGRNRGPLRLNDLPKSQVKVKVTQSCPALCNPMDYRVHGILQARILQWVAFPFSRVSSQPRDWTQVSRIAGRFFTSWATREAHQWLTAWGWELYETVCIMEAGTAYLLCTVLLGYRMVLGT